MKYIKLFNEARVEGTRMTQWYQPDQGEELLDFSIDSLAYLMDDGYKVIVETSSDVYDAIRIRKGDDPFVPPYNRQSFNWNEIKDTILPYLIRVNRRYDLEVVTFYTERLSGSTSFTKEGAAKIKDLLEEKTIPLYYDWNSKVDPRSQVFEEIKVKVKKLPLIYNRNESFDRLSRDKKSELQDYCETNLAYLMDEGFKIRIGQNITLNSKEYNNISIQITKKADFLEHFREDFFWKDVKDQIIPFVLRLEIKYDIEKIRFLGEDNFHYIKDDFEQELDSQPIRRVSFIDIYLSDEKESINESLSHKEEIEDFCDTHLAYLTDENFHIRYEEFYGGNVIKLEIGHDYREKEGFDFTWNEVKDRFIPFLQMLSKQYRLHNFHFEDKVVKLTAGLLSKFQSTNSITNYYTYNDIINDDLSPLGGNLMLESIMIKIGRKLI
jgi:hypothetical protein